MAGVTAPWPPPPPPLSTAVPPPPPAWGPPGIATADELAQIEAEARTVRDGPAVVDAPPPRPANEHLYAAYRQRANQCADKLPHRHVVELHEDRDGRLVSRWVEETAAPNREPWRDLPQRIKLTVSVRCVGRDA